MLTRIYRLELELDGAKVVITAQDFEKLSNVVKLLAETQPDDGWIPWDGTSGICPTPNDVYVSVRFRDGSIARDHTPQYWEWCHDENSKDYLNIVAYKIG